MGNIWKHNILLNITPNKAQQYTALKPPVLKFLTGHPTSNLDSVTIYLVVIQLTAGEP